MSLVDELKDWTDFETAAFVLGRTLGLFSEETDLAMARAVLSTNSAVGNSLYGMLDRLAWLGTLECDEEARRYRSARPRLHPLGTPDDVPSLETGPGPQARIVMSLEAPEGFRLEADRAGFRHLARVFDEIADSGLESGWQVRRNEEFKPGSGSQGFSFALVDSGLRP